MGLLEDLKLVSSDKPESQKPNLNSPEGVLAMIEQSRLAPIREALLELNRLRIIPIIDEVLAKEGKRNWRLRLDNSASFNRVSGDYGLEGDGYQEALLYEISAGSFTHNTTMYDEGKRYQAETQSPLLSMSASITLNNPVVRFKSIRRLAAELAEVDIRTEAFGAPNPNSQKTFRSLEEQKAAVWEIFNNRNL